MSRVDRRLEMPRKEFSERASGKMDGRGMQMVVKMLMSLIVTTSVAQP